MTGLDDLANQPAPAAPPLSGALEAELGKLAPVATRRPLRQLAVLFGISLVYGAGLLAVLAVRRDADQLPMGWLVGAALGWLCGFVIPIYFATVPRAGSVTPRWKLAAVAAVIASIGFIAFGLAIHPSTPKSASLGWDNFMRGHTCLEIGLLTALVPVVAGAIFLRGAMPVGSRWIAAALGAGGGSLGGLLLHLHCPITDAPHLGLVHGGVVLASAALAAAIVPRASQPR